MLVIIQNDPRVPAGRYEEQLRWEGRPYRILRPDRGEALSLPPETSALMVLGGYMSVHDTDEFPFLNPLKDLLRRWVQVDRPVLGICLGGQLLAAALGGKVVLQARGERGMLPVELTACGERDQLFAGIPGRFLSMQWHNDSFDPPAAAQHLAASRGCAGQAFRVGAAGYGLQFHPELTETIVAEWSSRAGLGDACLITFRQLQAAYLPVSLRLLRNFLSLAANR